MVYLTEDNLIRDFKKSFINSFTNVDGWLILEENKTNWGIVDILAIKFDSEKLLKRKKNITSKKIEKFTTLASYAITQIIQHPYITSEKLSSFLKIKNGLLNDTIQNLLNRKLIIQYSKGKLRANSIKDIYLIREIIAFEAKLNNWKKAVEQAERHLWFTNSSFIVLPTLSEKVISRVVKTCSEKGVGLILQSNKNNFEVLKQPLYKKHLDSILSWKINEALVDGSKFNGSSPLR